MNCTINSASHFSGLQAGMSPISLVQLAGSVRKFNLNRPFILPIVDLGSFFCSETFRLVFEINLWNTFP